VRDAGVVDDLGRPLRLEHVLLPLDGSDFALAAMPTARALSVRFGAQLHVISVADDEADADRLGRHARSSLGADLVDEQVHVVVGVDPADAITARAVALGSCLVCMSTRGRGRAAGTVIGSVTRQVLHSTQTPLVAVGPLADRPGHLVDRPLRRPSKWPEPLSVGGIAACVDGSPESEAVLAEAARWATALGERLSVLTVADDVARALDGTRPNRFGPADPQRYVDELADRWRRVVPCVGEVAFDPIGVADGVRAHLADRPAAILALTTHGRAGLERVRLGATAADIVQTSSAPTLVVPLPPG
jgi:nucleotide-binding universal stress UspA family protein